MIRSERIASSLFPTVHALSCSGIVLWILVDPLAKGAFVATVQSCVSYEYSGLLAQFGTTRCAAIAMIFVIGCVTLVWEIWQRFFSKSPTLTIRRMLMLTVVAAVWLALAFNLDKIDWQGKRLRSATRIDALERLAERLNEDWPSDAGEIAGLGPFTAYPFGEPRLLLLLTPHPLNSTNTVIAAIERSDAGALRFQLGGDDGGDWIEWHPTGARPANFTGGLEDAHQLKQASSLGGQWHLVRYRVQ